MPEVSSGLGILLGRVLLDGSDVSSLASEGFVGRVIESLLASALLGRCRALTACWCARATVRSLTPRSCSRILSVNSPRPAINSTLLAPGNTRRQDYSRSIPFMTPQPIQKGEKGRFALL